MPAAASGYAGFDADVSSVNSDDAHRAYLTALAEQNEAARDKIKAQIEGLKATLADVSAAAKSARAALEGKVK